MKRLRPNPPPKGGVIRTLIVDDSKDVRTSLVAFLAWVPRLKVVGTAADGAHALALIAGRHPHLVLMDISMPIMDGLRTAQLIRRRYPATRIILMGLYEGTEIDARCREAGADAFLSKVQFCQNLEAVIARLFPAPGERADGAGPNNGV
jgi:DNA-binding NarL/FixJ family response regulator